MLEHGLPVGFYTNRGSVFKVYPLAPKWRLQSQNELRTPKNDFLIKKPRFAGA